MKKESRKLNLNRETLAPLMADDLDNVNGGTSPVATSSTACIRTVGQVATAISAYFYTRGCQK